MILVSIGPIEELVLKTLRDNYKFNKKILTLITTIGNIPKSSCSKIIGSVQKSHSPPYVIMLKQKASKQRNKPKLKKKKKKQNCTLNKFID